MVKKANILIDKRNANYKSNKKLLDKLDEIVEKTVENKNKKSSIPR